MVDMTDDKNNVIAYVPIGFKHKLNCIVKDIIDYTLNLRIINESRDFDSIMKFKKYALKLLTFLNDNNIKNINISYSFHKWNKTDLLYPVLHFEYNISQSSLFPEYVSVVFKEKKNL